MKSISDSELVGLMDADVLRIQTCAGEVLVVKWHSGRRRFYRLSPTQHPVSGRWRYNVRLGRGRQRTVYRNRLVWLWENRRAVDEASDIDHIDRDNQNDLPDNLRLRDRVENRRDNYAKNLMELLEFFERPE